jgi:hypothetical protein
MTFPKRYLASESTNKWLRYNQKKIGKHAKLQTNHVFLTFFLIRFWREIDVFQFSFDEILAICWSILMQDTVLERLLVVDYMTEIC